MHLTEYLQTMSNEFDRQIEDKESVGSPQKRQVHPTSADATKQNILARMNTFFSSQRPPRIKVPSNQSSDSPEVMTTEAQAALQLAFLNMANA